MEHPSDTSHRARLLQWLHVRNASPPSGMDPAAFRPDAVAGTLRWVRRIFGPGRYLDIDIHGWEHVPPAPAMFVSNHSGGTSVPDVWGFVVAWYERFGVRRPMHPLAHDMILSTHAIGHYLEERGVLRANSEVAVAALRDHRHDLLVMPGGDLDTWRPYRERFRVRFGKRTGYVRTALRAGVPIVPMANAGAHETFYVLTDGRALARRLHLHEFARAEIFPIHLSLPWGVAIGPWPHLPVPSTLRYRLGAPIQPPRAFARDEPIDEALLNEIDAEVRLTVQALLDELAKQT